MYIEIKNFTKIIHNKKVLDNININFEKGKTYGLVGTNGCGKTMLLKAICGFVSPTVGSVTVNGTVLGNGVYAQNVGVIIENVGLWANLTAFENLKILSSASGKANDDDIKKYISLFACKPYRRSYQFPLRLYHQDGGRQNNSNSGM